MMGRMRRLLVIGLFLAIGFALGLARQAVAEGRCIYDQPAEAHLALASFAIDGATAPLDGVPATAVFEQPPRDSEDADPYPSLVIGGRSHALREAP